MDTREWVITNGTGSFASGTVCDAHTRTYHGWLIAALNPPVRRTLLFSHIEASLYVAGQAIDLGSNFWASGDVHPQGFQWLQSFSLKPVPTWVWGEQDWQVARQIVMPFGLTGYASVDDFCKKKQSQLAITASCSHRVLIRYRYDGYQTAILTLRPLIGDRSFHHQQRSKSGLQFSQLINDHSLSLQAIRQNWVGTPWTLSWSRGDYYPDGVWYWNFLYPEETRRGLSDTEDLYSPGYLVATLKPGASVVLEAQVGLSTAATLLQDTTFDQLLKAEGVALKSLIGVSQSPVVSSELPGLPVAETTQIVASMPALAASQPISEATASKLPYASLPQLKQRLWRASDRFITYRQSTQGATVIAGYPWFSDWGRDTLIALPGLTLTTGRFSIARNLLQTFATHCDYGLMPNAFPDPEASPFFNNLDVSLWWIEALGLYVEATQDWDFLITHYPTVQRIYKNLAIGTLHNIRIDASDSLITWNAAAEALTWMDVVSDGQPVTPRRGKAIEINGLWYSALRWAQRWAEWICQNTGDCPLSLQSQGRRYAQQAEQVEEALRAFWNPQQGYFYDCIGPDDEPDPSIRPNAVIALSLTHCGFSEDYARQALLVARDRLLTPYGLRSLERSDPAYGGHYLGNVFQRDRTYHQGTVWSWLIGPFIRAWKRFYPDQPLPFDGRPLLEHFQHEAAFDAISEIFDGDEPHAPQGAIAQAWSVAELIRHWDDIF